MENGGENRAFPKKLGRNRAVLESGAENSGILENGVENSGILENGVEKSDILENGTEIREKGWDSEKGVFGKIGLENGFHENGRKEQLAREGWSSKVKQA